MPAVSVIIPLYNAERYIGECLDSLLAQTFKNFEVIIVDDCSTDNSRAVVESYAPKFDGRLKLAQMEKNSGSGSLPRNKGLLLSRGEFIYNMDNDDAITETALEELYTLAKRHNVDFVYCERYYSADDRLENRERTSFFKEETLVNKPTVETPRLPECLDKLWVTPWTKLIKRKLLIENQIFFPNIIRDDTIWTWCLLFYAKRFLRVPNAVYIWREVPTSITRTDREPEQVINFWLNPVILGVKTLNERLQTIDFFQKNPQERYALLENFIQGSFKSRAMIKYRRQINPSDVFKAIKEKFAENLGEYDALIPALCSILIQEEASREEVEKTFRRFKASHIELQNILTARIDVEFSSNNTDDLKIVSVSDANAEIRKSTWLRGNNIGYNIQSCSGKLELVAKVGVNGQLRLSLKGVDARNPADKTKRIPRWVDYTKFLINGRKIFDKITPAWHDKSYNYNLNVKAGMEIKIQTEWQPHRNDVPVVAPPANKLFIQQRTARLDIHGDGFQLVSVSDEQADIKKPAFLQKDGVGYQIQSHVGNMKLVAKATANGQLSLKLRGLWVPDPVDKSKRLPYWIDYTKFIVNGEVIFDKVTPAWHDEPYNYTLDVKTDDEITIDVEWLPHRGAVPKSAPPKKVEPPVSKLSTQQRTARLDAKLFTEEGGDFQILSVSDEQAEVKKPAFLQKGGVGYQIQSLVGKMKLVAKATANGQLSLKLRGLWVPDPVDKSKRLPYWIDYTKFIVNDKVIFDKVTPTWHDEPYIYTLDVKTNEEITIDVEWLPHKSDT